MKPYLLRAFLILGSSLPALGGVPLLVEGGEVAIYQDTPLPEPKGGPAFKGSNFIHPLKTPSGFTVTDCQPDDHLHHFGLWWPWKFIEVETRKILCWELQNGDGIVETRSAENIPGSASSSGSGLLTRSLYIDRKATGGPTPRIKETTRITTSNLPAPPAPGYLLDLEIIHQVAGDQPVTISSYRYSGLGFRGSSLWNKDNSTLLTSENLDRNSSNSTRARWVRIEGKTGTGTTAGVIIMSHPSNHEHPEKLRTWDDKQHHGATFINFNPVMDKPWTFEPGTSYIRRYRLFIYDGTITPGDADTLWNNYGGK